MNSFNLKLDPGSMMFFTENNEESLLAFILTFEVPILETTYNFECRLQFNPRSKKFILGEYTFGQGFTYFELNIDILTNVANRQKIKITSPESENVSGVWLTYWNQKEEHKEKLQVYKAWWEENLSKIENHVLDRKEEFNQELQNIVDNLKIA
jgi:hypothetical protein